MPASPQLQISRAMDDIFTTTWYDRRRTVIDQVFEITPLLDMMFKQGRIKERVPDGTHYEIPIQVAKLDQNISWFDKGDDIGAEDKESLTVLSYEVKNLAAGIVRYWVDDRKNRGKARLINYLDTKLNNTKAALNATLESALWAQDPNPKAMTALTHLVSATPTTGTVGGHDRATYSILRNQLIDMTSDTFETDILARMTTMLNNCGKYTAGTRRTPDIIITTQEIYEDYEEVARAMQQIVMSKSERISLGFGELAFKGVELFWAPECPAGNMYFLNTEHLELGYDPLVWMEMTEWKPIRGTSLDKVAQIVSSCNMMADNFRKHGVITNIPALT